MRLRSGSRELTSTKPSRSQSSNASPQRVVEGAVNLDHTRAGGARLRALRRRRPAGGRQHDRTQPGPRRVGRGAGGSVSRRRADDRVRARLDRALDGDDHAAVLEAAGRVRALDLEVQVDAERLREARCADERRRALAEREPRGGLHAHPSSVTPRSETTGSGVERRLIAGSCPIAASASSRAPVAASCVTTCSAAPSPFCVLQQARDRDLAHRELLGDLRERARPVVDREAEVVRRARLARRQARRAAATRRRSAGSRCPSSRSRS